MEELKQLKQSVNVASAQIGFLSQGFKALQENFQDISSDLDAFIEVYEASQRKIDVRLNKIEEHIGI
ncbi:MAG: hypothetical protein AAGC88_10060 [Bacteroidota bacterium]